MAKAHEPEFEKRPAGTWVPPGDVAPTPDQEVLRGFRIVAPARGGILEDTAALHDRVEAGRVLGLVVDPYGGLVEEIVAPVSGVVYRCRRTPRSAPVHGIRDRLVIASAGG